MDAFQTKLTAALDRLPKNPDVKSLYNAVSQAVMEEMQPKWIGAKEKKRACYFSAEFLMGRMIYNNLLSAGLLEDCKAIFAQRGLDITVFEDVEDHALGNGGLGRLAACFLDSGAAMNLPLDGYGIRYKYGLFKQHFHKGFQQETPDDWQTWGDPWSVRREDKTLRVHFPDGDVNAVPYEMPVIGLGGDAVNTLCLWQAEPAEGWFGFDDFNRQDYAAAMSRQNDAFALSAVLYPNDDTDKGKRLRLRQQYFFSSASLQSILRDFTAVHGTDFSVFADFYAVQLNDTHPVISIPELLRLLMEDYGLDYPDAFAVATKTFSYTNHTVMPEALETWDENLFVQVVPRVYAYVVMLQNHLRRYLKAQNIQDREKYDILSGGRVHMARLALFACHTVNGVAKLHTELLKTAVLPEWNALYPHKFQNKTNGVSPRRWLSLCNPELSALITDCIGSGWERDLIKLKGLEKYAEDELVLKRFMAVKRLKKQQLCNLIEKREGVLLSPDFLFDVQIKRLHEYKRQLLNAFATLDTYYALREGLLPQFTPTAVLFGAKAAPGYYRAKGIIKFCNEIAKKINGDAAVRDKLRVVFVQNYNVSYAEQIIPAADVSEQISAAGTEASGTGNMKLMLNGAVTLGTLDGANIEIVEAAGVDNNYIFGKTVEELTALAPDYDPVALYKANPRLKRVVDSLVDGSFSDSGTGMFQELHDALLYGASWHTPDHYYLLADFDAYVQARLRVNRDYGDTLGFAKKCWLNIANGGIFSSDRTILQYAHEIWNVQQEGFL